MQLEKIQNGVEAQKKIIRRHADQINSSDDELSGFNAIDGAKAKIRVGIFRTVIHDDPSTLF